MSKLMDKLLYKILAIIIIVLFVVAFRELIITDKDFSTAFGALMGVLPFAKIISDVVCKILRYQYSIPLITTSSLLTDFIKLAFMAFIQPLIVGLFTALFLRIPSSGRVHEKFWLSSKRTGANCTYCTNIGYCGFMVFHLVVFVFY